MIVAFTFVIQFRMRIRWGGERRLYLRRKMAGTSGKRGCGGYSGELKMLSMVQAESLRSAL